MTTVLNRLTLALLLVAALAAAREAQAALGDESVVSCAYPLWVGVGPDAIVNTGIEPVKLAALDETAAVVLDVPRQDLRFLLGKVGRCGIRHIQGAVVG